MLKRQFSLYICAGLDCVMTIKLSSFYGEPNVQTAPPRGQIKGVSRCVTPPHRQHPYKHARAHTYTITHPEWARTTQSTSLVFLWSCDDG